MKAPSCVSVCASTAVSNYSGTYIARLTTDIRKVSRTRSRERGNKQVNIHSLKEREKKLGCQTEFNSVSQTATASCQTENYTPTAKIINKELFVRQFACSCVLIASN
jgi:hypothetical protein